MLVIVQDRVRQGPMGPGEILMNCRSSCRKEPKHECKISMKKLINLCGDLSKIKYLPLVNGRRRDFPHLLFNLKVREAFLLLVAWCEINATSDLLAGLNAIHNLLSGGLGYITIEGTSHTYLHISWEVMPPPWQVECGMIYENGNEPEFSLTTAILPAGARLIGKTRARPPQKPPHATLP